MEAKERRKWRVGVGAREEILPDCPKSLIIYRFSVGHRILPDYGNHDVGLSNTMARPMKLRCCVFNKVFLVNHWRDILNCSCKWLRFSRCPKP